jgi:hypothetical protein
MTRFSCDCVYLKREGTYMRQLFCILVALMCSSGAFAGAKRWSDRVEGVQVDPMSSAAIFVGVRDFSSDRSIQPVPYAVDDAVDLAYELSIDRQPALVNPAHIVLALSGEPQKPETRGKLAKLLSAGAVRKLATKSDILTLLDEESRLVGTKGILIVAFATHGVSEDGIQYLFTADSKLTYFQQTTLSDGVIRDAVSKNGVARSLILFDACRERLTRDKRNGEPDPRAVAAFLRDVSAIDGQVVISAAPAGGYAYDDDDLGNGVFTRTLIDGLRCGAASNRQGYVTVDTLYSYVSKNVLSWVQGHKNPRAKTATQLMCEGDSKRMPLSICINHTASASPPSRR